MNSVFPYPLQVGGSLRGNVSSPFLYLPQMAVSPLSTFERLIMTQWLDLGCATGTIPCLHGNDRTGPPCLAGVCPEE